MARAGGARATFPRAPSRASPSPHSDLRGRWQSSYLQRERASAAPTAAASWSRTRRWQRGSNHFGGGWHGRRVRAERRRFRGARSAAGLWVQAWLGPARSSRPLDVCLLTPWVDDSVRPPGPLRLGQGDQPSAALSSLSGLSAPGARPGIRLWQAPTLRPAPRRPLPLRRWDARLAPGACNVAPGPAGAAKKRAGVGAALTFLWDQAR